MGKSQKYQAATSLPSKASSPRLGDPHLRRAAWVELGAVGAEVERLRQRRVDERDVQPLEIIVDVEHPVGGDVVVAHALGIEDERVERQRAEPAAYRRQERLGVDGRLQRGQDQRAEARRRQQRQMIARRRKIDGALELGRVRQLAVEREATAVIAAAQRRRLAGLLAQDGAAMRADVRQAAQRLAVAHQQQRFVERARQEREGHDAAGAHVRRVGRQLPARHEDALDEARVQLGRAIGLARQRLGACDVGVDGEAHGVDSSRCAADSSDDVSHLGVSSRILAAAQGCKIA